MSATDLPTPGARTPGEPERAATDAAPHACACGEGGCGTEASDEHGLVEVGLDDYLADLRDALPTPVPAEPAPYDAVLLVGFGGPEGQDDVIPYLRNVTRGRGIPDERLEEVAVHYRAHGGVSPINQQNRDLRAALLAELDARGLDLPVYWGNRNWDPYLPDAITEAAANGHTRLLAVVTAAYSSYSGCRQYREDLAAAIATAGLTGQVTIDKVRQYYDSPGFVDPFVEGVRGALERLRAQEGVAPDGVRVLFATHSIPTAAASATGPQTGADDEGEYEIPWAEGGAYDAQHYAVADAIMAAVDTTVPWELVYQSRSGNPRTPWLEPDINDRIEELAKPVSEREDPEDDQAVDAVVIVPLGFVSDHMEVLWDLDNEAMTTAREHAILAERVPTPGVHPAFVSGLVDLVAERTLVTAADGTTAPAGGRCGSATTLGPWYDVCRPGCCLNPVAEPLPAVAGEVP